MSWTLQGQFSRMEMMQQGDPIGETLVRQFIERQERGDGSTSSAVIENQLDHNTAFETFNQVSHGVAVARTLVNAVGGNWLRINVHISGHANPDHGAKEGWANDSVHVSVSVLEYLETGDAHLDDNNENTQAPRLVNVNE